MTSPVAVGRRSTRVVPPPGIQQGEGTGPGQLSALPALENSSKTRAAARGLHVQDWHNNPVAQHLSSPMTGKGTELQFPVTPREPLHWLLILMDPF